MDVLNPMPESDARRARGAKSRAAILEAAMHETSIRGLAGLSIGGLAVRIGMSKSGVAALFRSKENLQLATISAAREVFTLRVVAPTQAIQGGRARMDALVSNWIDHSRERVFAGGSFFGTVNTGASQCSAAVRASILAADEEWRRFVTRTVASAQLRGELWSERAPEQLAFEIIAVLEAANSASVVAADDEAYDRAVEAIRHALAN